MADGWVRPLLEKLSVESDLDFSADEQGDSGVTGGVGEIFENLSPVGGDDLSHRRQIDGTSGAGGVLAGVRINGNDFAWVMLEGEDGVVNAVAP